MVMVYIRASIDRPGLTHGLSCTIFISLSRKACVVHWPAGGWGHVFAERLLLDSCGCHGMLRSRGSLRQV